MRIRPSKGNISFIKENCWAYNVLENGEEITFYFFPYWIFIHNDGSNISIIDNPKEHPLLGEEYKYAKETVLWMIGAIGDSKHHVCSSEATLTNFLNEKFNGVYSKEYIEQLENVYDRVSSIIWYKPWTWKITRA